MHICIAYSQTFYLFDELVFFFSDEFGERVSVVKAWEQGRERNEETIFSFSHPIPLALAANKHPRFSFSYARPLNNL